MYRQYLDAYLLARNMCNFMKHYIPMKFALKFVFKKYTRSEFTMGHVYGQYEID